MDFQGVPSQLSSKAEFTIVPLRQMKLPQWQSLFLTKNHLEENSTFTKLCDFTPLGYLFSFLNILISLKTKDAFLLFFFVYFLPNIVSEKKIEKAISCNKLQQLYWMTKFLRSLGKKIFSFSKNHTSFLCKVYNAAILSRGENFVNTGLFLFPQCVPIKPRDTLVNPEIQSTYLPSSFVPEQFGPFKFKYSGGGFLRILFSLS